MSFSAWFSSARALSQLPWRSCARAAAVNASAAGAVALNVPPVEHAGELDGQPAGGWVVACRFREEQALARRDEHVSR